MGAGPQNAPTGSVVLVYELIPGMQLDCAVGCMDLLRLDRFRVIYDISGAVRYLHSQELCVERVTGIHDNRKRVCSRGGRRGHSL